MSFTEAELDNLSTLARVDILPEEKQKMLADMQAIIGYVSEINNTEEARSKEQGVSGETKDEMPFFNVVREDIVTRETGSNTEALLNETPATEDGYVKVEQVFK